MKQTAKQYHKNLVNRKCFTKLTCTGISSDLDNVFEFAEGYLASYKAELSKLIDSCEYEFLDGDWYHKDDGDGANPIKTLTLLSLLEDNPTEK